jgi:hypothetical protein
MKIILLRKVRVDIPFQANAADLEILKDKGLYYRVFDLTAGDPFASSRASYFHKSIGGYHGAKMRRYQELYDHHFKEDIDEDILDMLNTKYLILRDPKTGEFYSQKRSTNLGNAWFVSEYEMVKNADEEIEKVGKINPAQTAAIDKRFSGFVDKSNLQPDSLAVINLISYAPNKLTYKFVTRTEQMAIFSDIYYPKGWLAAINGKEVSHFRVDYVLRGLIIPAGEGEISFEFKPNSYFIGIKIAMAASIILVLLILSIVIKKTWILKK